MDQLKKYMWRRLDKFDWHHYASLAAGVLSTSRASTNFTRSAAPNKPVRILLIACMRYECSKLQLNIYNN